MDLPAAVTDRLGRLAPDQRAAATAPCGPVLCVAPAGSGKTTTLVARVAWLVATGVEPEAITVLAFNRRAAEELATRIDSALASLTLAAGSVRVRTFHALGLEILREAGVPVRVVDRAMLLRRLFPDHSPAELARLDLAFARLKLDHGVTAADVAADVAEDPAPAPTAAAFLAYERALAAAGALDFDDLVARARALLQADPGVLGHWRARCVELLVDEAQDLDRSQLALALLLAAPGNRVFLVGDDDQTIYGWRLADVRRILGLGDALPGLRRVDLTVNYRCPPVVVERAVRLVECNRERFAKRITAGPTADGRLVLAADESDEPERIRQLFRTWPADGSTRAILARTNRELLPAAVMALDAGIPFRAPGVRLLVEDRRLDRLLDAVGRLSASWPLLVRVGRVRDALARGELVLPALAGDPADPLEGPESDLDALAPDALAGSLLAWAAAHADLDALAHAIADRRRRLAELRRDDAALTLATAHATKGAEWDHVAVLMDGFPARRAVATALDPARVFEEERRLAYVAWTRARRSLTLVYEPSVPSPFLLEAFGDEELGIDRAAPA